MFIVTNEGLQYVDDSALAHYGVKGMKWGVRKKRYDARDRSAARKKSIEQEKKEADADIKFFGGKAAAVNAAREETAVRRKSNTLKGAAKASLSVAAGYGSVAAVAAAGGPIGLAVTTFFAGVAGAAHFTAVTAKANTAIKQYGDRRIAYIQDSDVAADTIFANIRKTGR